MDPRHLDLAAQFCEMVGFDDLIQFFNLDDDVTPEVARAALKKKRGFYQSMQANPKHRDKAKFYIKHYRALDAVLGDLPAHLAHMARARSEENLPMLEMAIDSVLSDGLLTPVEEKFIRDSAESIGIDPDTFERVLNQRLQQSGARRAQDVGQAPHIPAPPSFGGATATLSSVPIPVPKKKRRKRSDGWWTPAFTDLLLSVIPQGTTRMVDLACSSAWSALALLPERDRLQYLGVDRDEERIELARKAVGASPLGSRVALIHGMPHELPLEDASVDLVLSVMALRYFYDTEPIFREAHRVLKEGGRFVVVEPDGLSQMFYFDGHLNVLNKAYRSFMRVADTRLGESRTGEFFGRPGLAIGPELGARLKRVGFKPHRMAVHPIQGFRQETISEFAERVSRSIDSVSRRAELSPTDKHVRAARRALHDLVDMIDPDEIGYGGQLQPVFVAVGLKT